MDNKDYHDRETARWLLIAERDLNMAAKNQDEFPETSAYLFQQAAEKYLKAFLFFHQEPINKTHDISRIILQCVLHSQDFLRLARTDTERLTRMATYYRYPNDDGVDNVDEDDLIMAREFALTIQSMVLSAMPDSVMRHLDDLSRLSRDHAKISGSITASCVDF
ncbi:MAG: HEPN domain-containing protein [Halothiobacillaceae bacterium]|nr:MAG: HEPN domain-containing protein [Halothiobacillaceae bacterium]